MRTTAVPAPAAPAAPVRPLATGGVVQPLQQVAAVAPVPRTARWPWVLVAVAVAWNLVDLRAETLAVSYLDDSSIHEQMVRFAVAQLQSGHLPLTSWFPFLGLGSPEFLHYQSLPAMLTGLIGLAIGPDPAFRWTLYLLLSLWPISVYLSARLFGCGRPAAALSAAMSPFLVSASGIGYEQHAYVWIGYGVWTQLWASWTLPLAWGFSWRAIRAGRGVLAAVVLVTLTIALHFETGYLALAPLLFWPLVAGAPLAQRAFQAAMIAAGSLLAALWVIVPLLEQRAWAATNEPLQGTGLVNGYGAGRVLGWLASGQLLDHGRLPVVTLFAAIGFALACARARRDGNARALLVALGTCLLLSFGRATFGALADVLPGAGDIFFRRMMMGAQLVALLLAGTGAVWAARAILSGIDRPLAGRVLRRARESAGTGFASSATLAATGRARAAVAAGAVAATIAVLAPAWLQLGSYDRQNAAAITAQRRADATQGADVDQLIAFIKANGGGRVYAGMPSNWGNGFMVGQVPVFKYLDSRDIDEVGYTLRTASLMTDPEYHFDEGDPGDYRLFGIHYLIVPAGYLPPVSARLTMRSGQYWLWAVDAGGYINVGRTVGELTANRTNVGRRSTALLRSGLAQAGDYLRLAYGKATGEPGSIATVPSAPRQPPVGAVNAETDNLASGESSATVTMREPGVAVLSASLDSGWTVTVDGRRQAVRAIAPALVGADLPAGTHTVAFRYRGFGDYAVLFALCALIVAALAGAELIRRRTAPARLETSAQTLPSCVRDLSRPGT